jgi:hypothetical protein
MGLANLIRAGMSFRMNALFSTLQVTLLLPLGIMYALSGIVFIALAVIWRKNQQFPAFFTILGYEIFMWIVRIMTFRSSYARSIWLRDGVFSLLFLGAVFFLSHKPRKVQNAENYRRRM